MKNKKTVWLFTVLVIYVFASFSWWSYLLIEKNKCAFEDGVSYKGLKYNYVNNLPPSSSEYKKTLEYQDILTEYNRQKMMIIGEGAVFLILLSIGTFQLWSTFRKEMNLARQQNNFMLSITHELKSPLAAIKLSLQTIIKRAELADKFKQFADNSLEDIDRLNELVNNILFASRMEVPTYTIHRQEENLSEIIYQIIDKIKIMHKDKIEFKIEIEENVLVKIDRLSLSSTILNLVENAVKYAVNSPISILLKKSTSRVIIEIGDHGLGIPDEEKENVFKKFYRVGNEETRETKGTGLGLFIVKRTVEMHKGKVVIIDNKPKGATFRLTLPINTS